MARRRPIALVLAVLSFLNAGRFLDSEPWFGLASLVLGILLLAQYFSDRFRTFTDRHRIAFGTVLAVIFAAVGFHFFRTGQTDFAIAIVLCLLVLVVLLALDLYSKHYMAR